MLFWRGRLRVDFLPSFELISGVTHAILDEVRECRAGDRSIPLAFRRAAGQIRDEWPGQNKAAYVALASTRTVRRTCSGFGSKCGRPVVLHAPHTSATATVREVSSQVAQKHLCIAQIRCIKALCELIIH
jgi:hypothetical protein